MRRGSWSRQTRKIITKISADHHMELDQSLKNHSSNNYGNHDPTPDLDVSRQAGTFVGFGFLDFPRWSSPPL